MSVLSVRRKLPPSRIPKTAIPVFAAVSAMRPAALIESGAPFGPKGWPISKCEMDFRTGGEFHMQMTSDEGEPGRRRGD